ncbi:MAG: hypothetical protein M9909_01185 [Thermomicrobiales bacterium]|nr:hypothetical protein [Thermomicrobiales bacterium]
MLAELERYAFIRQVCQRAGIGISAVGIGIEVSAVFSILQSLDTFADTSPKAVIPASTMKTTESVRLSAFIIDSFPFFTLDAYAMRVAGIYRADDESPT